MQYRILHICNIEYKDPTPNITPIPGNLLEGVTELQVWYSWVRFIPATIVRIHGWIIRGKGGVWR